MANLDKTIPERAFPAFTCHGRRHGWYFQSDVTERKEIETDLWRSKEQHRALVESVGEAVYSMDRECRYGFISDKLAARYNMSAHEMSKPTKLTNIEFTLIKLHPERGYEILKDIDFSWPIARMVLEHHERMNGSGYPKRLSGDKLLLESRILSVADVVESIASHRPYRPALGIDVGNQDSP